MAHIDLTSRRLELQVVYWGALQSGTTSTLRCLHAACPTHARGELATVEHPDAGLVCDYVPIDLPRWGDLAVRAHVYTMPAGEGPKGAQRRILAGADAVVFVADARPEAAEGNLAAWRALSEALQAQPEGAPGAPTFLAANHADRPGALPASEWAQRLMAALPGRPIETALDASALSGSGVLDGFRQALVAAADRAVGAQDVDHALRRAFQAAFDERFQQAAPKGSPPAPPDRSPSRRVTLPSATTDGTGLNMALDVSRWLAVRDLDVRRLQRERALGRLLLEVGQTCLAATDPEALVRRILGALTMNLDAVSGWIGLPDGPSGLKVYDPMGVSADGAAFADTAHVLGLGLSDGGVVAVGAETGALLPGGAVGGRGLFAPFAAGDGARGWILLVGPPDRGLPEDAEAVLAPAGAFVGLTLARLSALRRLRESNAALEERVTERTHELQREKATLEDRVRERTRELEEAKRASVEAERKMLDRERGEGVQRLAAGLAHELNNPIGAALANLDFTLDGLRRLSASTSGRVGAELTDLLAASEDARRDLRRVAHSITSLFGQATSSRRAAVKTPLVAAVKDAIRDHVRATPGAQAPALVVHEGVACGVPPAECARWLFRLLGALDQCRIPGVQVEIDRGPDGPRVLVACRGEVPATFAATASALARELTQAGGRLDAPAPPGPATVQLVLPPALGESSMIEASVLRSIR